ncbi:AEC family transporter [Streptomyces sp. P38-E01]|uniref:AEC family transporter n=1 Tax=Streptomyces tardus TaxID=2780544 RepID=A0A949JGM8_9ACTN|nr:AEC family transporter [Streptomyces tardus]MBU7598199.1 AEC family transporter [Streptomyces tardus]
MNGLLTGFATIGSIVALGLLLAHVRVLDESAQHILSRLAFYVASPALLVTVLADTDISDVLSSPLLASIGSVLVVGVAQILLARLVWKRNAADTTIGAFSAAYVNAGNLGLPIAGYVLGDAALIAPMLLIQLLLMQPLGLTVLDIATSEGPHSWRTIVRRPLTNPLLIGSAIGVLLSVLDLSLPAPVQDPLELVAGMAIPAMLIAYGISLRLGPLPGRGTHAPEVAVIVLLKVVVQPLVAFLLARYVLDLDQAGVLAVTVIAALPTAQNIFVHASRYGTGVLLARDSIFVSTILSVPALLVIAAVLV